jgi:type VI secretion system protein ImpI
VSSSLTLEVVGPDARRLGSASRKVFNVNGGTIGRLPDNTWVLPDQHISGRHAVIRHGNGTFYVVDTSSNGVFVNSMDSRLQKNQPYALKDGDRLFIDAYEIRVAIEDRKPEAARSSPLDSIQGNPFAAATAGALIPDDPFADDSAGQTAAPLAASPVPLQPMKSGGRNELPPGFAPLPNAEVDPMALLGLAPKRAQPTVPKAEDLMRGSPLSEPYRPPPVRVTAAAVDRGGPLGAQIPSGYDPLAPDEPAHSDAGHPQPTPNLSQPQIVADATMLESSDQPPIPAARPQAQAVLGADFSALLAAAGIDDAAATPELIENFGRILRIVVSGTMDLLRVREGIKDEFRMRMTTFKAADNNPLKFSANVEDALHNLLVKRNSAYLPAVDAFKDAFQDARNHQMAMLAGLRVAFDGMLQEFDPQRLQGQFDQQLKKNSLLPMPGRLKYWELYRDWYENIAKDADSAFRSLFGEEFARAYEEQMQRLKTAGRS